MLFSGERHRVVSVTCLLLFSGGRHRASINCLLLFSGGRHRSSVTCLLLFSGGETQSSQCNLSLVIQWGETQSQCNLSLVIQWGETQSQCNRLKLVDLIVKPWQRLTKYKLLLYAVRKPFDKQDTDKVRESLPLRIDEQKEDMDSMVGYSLHVPHALNQVSVLI